MGGVGPSVEVIVPVLDRPHRVEPTLESLRTSFTPADGRVHVTFVCSPEDEVEIAAVRAAGLDPMIVSWPAGPGDFARKTNAAASAATEARDVDWFFTGADDLRFHPGWLRTAVSRHVHVGALVIGTNDLGNPYVMRGLYATHLLVHRDYVERGTIDEPGKLLHEGYDHNCCDTELVETAKSRRTFAFAKDSHVEHLHPSWHKGVVDATYRKGREHHGEDRRRLDERRPLWGGSQIGYRSRRARQPLTQAERRARR